MAHDPITDLKRYAAALEAQVSRDRSRQAARMALHTPSPARSPRRAVIAIATTVLMGVSNVALANVADPAVPGDALYGIDRAYEQVGSIFGSSDTHAGERAAEVLVLQERGKSAEALDLVQETLETLLASDDPKAAVEEFTAGLGNERFKIQLEKLIDAAKGVDPSDESVADIARLIVGTIVLPDQARGNPPEEAGPSDGQGPADRPTPPVTPGEGKPTQPGQSGDRP